MTTTLKNGAIVLQKKQVGPNDHVVLAQWPQNPEPFVTWHMNNKGDTFWGHYFKELVKAAEDFDKRGLHR